MKRNTYFVAVRSVLLLCFLALFQVAVWAQENTQEGGDETNTTTTTTTTEKTRITLTTDNGANDWYTSPWVWIVGAAVFILLLVALLTNRGRDTVTSDRVTVKKTVERDRGPDI